MAAESAKQGAAKTAHKHIAKGSREVNFISFTILFRLTFFSIPEL